MNENPLLSQCRAPATPPNGPRPGPAIPAPPHPVFSPVGLA